MSANPPDADGLVADYGLLEDASAVFDATRTYRYLLTRTWGSTPAAVFLMLNPSTADAMQDDPTIRRCIGFAKREGCGGLTVVNLFALRSTDPAMLRDHPDPVGPRNDEFIRERCAPGALVVAAWGALYRLRDRGEEVTAMLHDAGVQLRRLGLTAGGEPRHPLYLPADAPLVCGDR